MPSKVTTKFNQRFDAVLTLRC